MGFCGTLVEHCSVILEVHIIFVESVEKEKNSPHEGALISQCLRIRSGTPRYDHHSTWKLRVSCSRGDFLSQPWLDSPVHLVGSTCTWKCHHFLGYRFKCLWVRLNLIFQFLLFNKHLKDKRRLLVPWATHNANVDKKCLFVFLL